MSKKPASRNSALVVAAASALVLAAAPAMAQGNANPPANPRGPAQGVPFNTDRGNIPPGLVDNPGRGGGRPNQNVSGGEAVSVAPATVANVTAALRAGTLTTPNGAVIAREAQMMLHRLVATSGKGADAKLVTALTAGGNADAHLQAVALTGALQGLLAAPARQLQPAAVAYNAFVDASSTAFLSAPPAELLAVQAVLLPMVQQATAASK